MKYQLTEEFDVCVSGAEAHEKLRTTKKSSKESLYDYYLRMLDLGRTLKVDEASIRKYVIDGIYDDPCNKAMLFGAKSMKEFKRKLEAQGVVRCEERHEKRE